MAAGAAAAAMRAAARRRLGRAAARPPAPRVLRAAAVAGRSRRAAARGLQHRCVGGVVQVRQGPHRRRVRTGQVQPSLPLQGSGPDLGQHPMIATSTRPGSAALPPCVATCRTALAATHLLWRSSAPALPLSPPPPAAWWPRSSGPGQGRRAGRYCQPRGAAGGRLPTELAFPAAD